MNAFQSSTFEVTVRLLDAGSVPVTGVAAADLSLRTRKQGATTFTALTPLPTTYWQELEDGFYILRLPGTLINTIGSFFYELYGPGIVPIFDEVTVWPPLPSVRPDRCVVTGTISDVAGEPVILGARISFRLIDAPVALNGVFVQGGYYETHADAYGNFSISLLRGIKVVVELESSGIRQTITVPDQATARLIDLLPPLP